MDWEIRAIERKSRTLERVNRRGDSASKITYSIIVAYRTKNQP